MSGTGAAYQCRVYNISECMSGYDCGVIQATALSGLSISNVQPIRCMQQSYNDGSTVSCQTCPANQVSTDTNGSTAVIPSNDTTHTPTTSNNTTTTTSTPTPTGTVIQVNMKLLMVPVQNKNNSIQVQAHNS